MERTLLPLSFVISKFSWDILCVSFKIKLLKIMYLIISR